LVEQKAIKVESNLQEIVKKIKNFFDIQNFGMSKFFDVQNLERQTFLTFKNWNVKIFCAYFLPIFFSLYFFFFNAYDFKSVINSNLFLISLKINLYEKKLLKKRNGFIGYF
jgi:hypothetical protein